MITHVLIHALIWYLLLPALLVVAVLTGLHHLPSSRAGAASAMRGTSPAARAANWVRDAVDRVWHQADQLRRPAAPPVARAVPALSPSGAAPPPFVPARDSGPDPAEVTAMLDMPLPPPWQPLIGFVAGFNPENAADHIAFLQGSAAGFVALAEAYMSYADTCLNDIGLDPAAVHTIVELAELTGENAHNANLVVRKFMVVYGKILEALADGVKLPHDARTWLSGEGAA